ncbi:hypothetical protein [Thaumasiovibrio subtropicus]|uniref:hypothetical protein n=1 Tax=Thaumasiovibrio subtropicus TaxID=1891207 RepID=UPI000B351551|nr:hypothetical protein [Thaumasiovibrio subtropicus]
MKKMNSSYRLQLIKEVAQRRQRITSPDEMSLHIAQILEQRESRPPPSMTPFANSHFDEHAGGWVSDLWDAMK